MKRRHFILMWLLFGVILINSQTHAQQSDLFINFLEGAPVRLSQSDSSVADLYLHFEILGSMDKVSKVFLLNGTSQDSGNIRVDSLSIVQKANAFYQQNGLPIEYNRIKHSVLLNINDTLKYSYLTIYVKDQNNQTSNRIYYQAK